MNNFYVSNGKLYFETTCLANFDPAVRGVFCRLGTNQPALLVIEYIVSGYGTPCTIQVQGSHLRTFNFESVDFACRYLGSRSKSRQLVNDYLCQQAADMLSANTCGVYVDALGWHNLPAPVFSAGGGLTGMQPAHAVCLARELTGTRLACDADLDANTAVTGLINAFQRTPETMVAFSFTLFTSMRSLLQQVGLPVSCILYIAGTQGFGKSQLAKRFCTLLDDTARKLPANSFDAGSTFASIRDALAQQRDQIVLLDDLCRSSVIGEETERRKLLSKVIRSATNTTAFGKKAGAQNAEVNCTAGLVVTAEMLPESASELTRCILLQIDRPLAFQPDDRCFAAASFRYFLLWFAEHQADEIQQFRRDFDAFVGARQNTVDLRLYTAHWQQAWVLSCFCRFAIDRGVISNEAVLKMKDCFSSLARQAIANTLATLKRLIPVRPEEVAALTTQGLQTRHIPATPHNGCLYVRLEILTEYLRRVTQQPSLDPKSVSAALLSAGMLETDNSGKNTKKLDGRRYLAIRCRQ